MQRFTSSLRRPVKRERAEHYLLITLLSYAASVTLTRLFLELTGYPQLGTSYLHIAHVLWGGLLLFASSLLPMVVANRWAYTVGALLSGAGVGLFIDEVGKFITQANDYFAPIAAPIVYGLFLLNVLLYLRIRKPPTMGARAELYRALDAMEEVLEHDLDPDERAELKDRLSYVAENSEQPDLARLARDLLNYLSHEALQIAPPRSSWLNRITQKWEAFEQAWFTQARARAILAGALFSLGLVALSNLLASLPVGPGARTLPNVLENLFESGVLTTEIGLSWFSIRVALEASTGLLMLLAGSLLIARRENAGITIGSLGLLLSLIIVDLLVFYFDQFSAIITASVQFLVFLGVTYYRRRFLETQEE